MISYLVSCDHVNPTNFITKSKVLIIHGDGNLVFVVGLILKKLFFKNEMINFVKTKRENEWYIYAIFNVKNSVFL